MRTPLQAAAKRLYDALVDAEYECMDLEKHLDSDLAGDRHMRIKGYIQSAFDACALLMHEDDCDE